MKLYLLHTIALAVLVVSAGCGHKPDEQSRVSTKVVVVSDHARGWLGVSIEDVTSRLARSKDLKIEEGAYVNRVESESPASDAGILKGDVIVEFDGKKVRGSDDLIDAVRSVKAGTEVSVGVMRGNDRKALKATIQQGPRSRSFSLRTPRIHPRPHLRHFNMMRSASLHGLTVETLDRQLAEYFGAPGGKGVLVKSVKSNSDAEKAGFKAGDVIVKVGKQSVGDVRDLFDAFDDHKADEKAEIEILRKGASQKLNLTVKQKEVDWSCLDCDGEEAIVFDLFTPGESERWEEEADRLKHELKRMKEGLQDHMIELKERIKNEIDRARQSVKI